MSTLTRSSDRMRVAACSRVAAALIVLHCAIAPARAQSFADVQATAGSGDYAAARELARSLADPAERARALVWLDYGARDYEGAWREAVAGLAITPGDTWLAERRAAAALASRSGSHAAAAVEDLSKLVHSLPADDPTRVDLAAVVANYRTLADELVRAANAGRTARERARWTALGVLASAVVLVGWALRAPGQRISNKPEPSRE